MKNCKEEKQLKMIFISTYITFSVEVLNCKGGRLMDSTLLQCEEDVVDLVDLREAQSKTGVLYKSS